MIKLKINPTEKDIGNVYNAWDKNNWGVELPAVMKFFNLSKLKFLELFHNEVNSLSEDGINSLSGDGMNNTSELDIIFNRVLGYLRIRYEKGEILSNELSTYLLLTSKILLLIIEESKKNNNYVNQLDSNTCFHLFNNQDWRNNINQGQYFVFQNFFSKFFFKIFFKNFFLFIISFVIFLYKDIYTYLHLIYSLVINKKQNILN